MDEIVNYNDLNEEEKVRCLNELLKTSYGGNAKDIKNMKYEMDKSMDGCLPQFVFVRRKNKVVGYMFLIGEQMRSRIFPWYAVENADELPLETDLRLLHYGVDLCTQSGCLKLADMLCIEIENHRNGIGRRTV